VFAVALVGSDGAGKTTVTRRVGASLPFPAKTIYMGVNLDMHEPMLPTTRLILELKRAMGRRPDLVAASSGVNAGPRIARRATASSQIASIAKMLNWVAEEWFRQAIAWYHARLRGRVVVFDRHFFADYYAYDVAPGAAGRSLASRFHGQVLRRAYPKPDLFVFLDAPPEVLLARQGEGTLEFLERRRRDYLALRDVVRDFVVVDANRPADEVAQDVVHIITRFHATRNGTPGEDQP
jgi:thymidylate kinase